MVNAFSFDINAGGCPASLYSLIIGSQFISNGQCENVLVIVGDVMSNLIDWENRNCNYFFGDGAGAYLLGRVKKDKGISSYILCTDGTKYDEIIIPSGGSRKPITQEALKERENTMKMRTKKVKEFVLNRVPKAILDVVECAGMQIGNIDGFYLHQANLRLIETIFKQLDISMSKTHTVIEKYGNTGGSSLLVTMNEAIEIGKIRPGQEIVIASFGSGYQWGAVCMTWCGIEDFYINSMSGKL
jgi:3-oxoacyl-[acyl-carrier-protein] synthase-3